MFIVIMGACSQRTEAERQGQGCLAAKDAASTGEEVSTEAACVDTHAVGAGRRWPFGGRDVDAGDEPSWVSFHLEI